MQRRNFILLAEEMGEAAIKTFRKFQFAGNTDCKEGSWGFGETGDRLREMCKMSLKRKISFL